MIAAELAELLGGDLGVSSVDDLTDAIAANVAGFGAATVAALRTARDGIVVHGLAAAGHRARPTRSTTATATTTASSSAASCTTTRVGTAHVAVAGPSGDGLASCTCTRSTSSGVGSTDGADVKVTSKRGIDGVQGRRRRHASCAARRGCRSTSPGPSIGELIDCVRRRHRRAGSESF